MEKSSPPTPSPYDWLREIKPDLKQHDAIPLTGTAPPFPWEEFSDRLSKIFGREKLQVEPGEIAWRSKESLDEGLGGVPYSIALSVSPLQGMVYWIMPAQEVPSLAALLLTGSSHPPSLSASSFTDTYIRFATAECLYQLSQVFEDKTLFPMVVHQEALPSEDALGWDISLHIDSFTFLGRLIIPPLFRNSWVNYFAQKAETTPLSQQIAEAIDIVLHLEAGKVQLPMADWKSVKVGDFLILDSCSLDPAELTGRVMLTRNGEIAFRAKLKEGTLKILEPPLSHEADTYG